MKSYRAIWLSLADELRKDGGSVTRQGNYYTVRVITGVKPQPAPSNGTSLSAEEAAKRIAQRFGRSLAVLAD